MVLHKRRELAGQSIVHRGRGLRLEGVLDRGLDVLDLEAFAAVQRITPVERGTQFQEAVVAELHDLAGLGQGGERASHSRQPEVRDRIEQDGARRPVAFEDTVARKRHTAAGRRRQAKRKTGGSGHGRSSLRAPIGFDLHQCADLSARHRLRLRADLNGRGIAGLANRQDHAGLALKRCLTRHLIGAELEIGCRAAGFGDDEVTRTVGKRRGFAERRRSRHSHGERAFASQKTAAERFTRERQLHQRLLTGLCP